MGGGVWAPGPPPQWRGSKRGLRPPLAGSRGGAPAEKCNIRVSNGKIASMVTVNQITDTV